MLPALVGQLVVILKDSALGTAITYPELLQAAKDVGTAYGNVIPAYVLAAVIFILINYGLTVVAGRVERRLNRRGRGPRRAAPRPVVTGASTVGRGHRRRRLHRTPAGERPFSPLAGASRRASEREQRRRP